MARFTRSVDDNDNSYFTRFMLRFNIAIVLRLILRDFICLSNKLNNITATFHLFIFNIVRLRKIIDKSNIVNKNNNT